jgi:4-hydroxybenzoate polyprenyltransferase
MWAKKVQIYGRLIKFSHTVFALPFALAAVLLAHREHPVAWTTLALILAAMAAARSAAMGFNRYADFDYDRLNPRTAGRPLTAGLVDKKSVLVLICLSALAFVAAAALLGRLCFVLSLPVLAVLFIYSYTKRFTSLSHLVLGFAIGLAPAGAWIGAAGGLDPRVLLLSFALMTYIAGFDVLYACQDIDFDRRQGLFSGPVCWGVPRALKISALLHLASFLFLIALGFAFALGRIYLIFLLAIGVLLAFEHWIVKPGSLDRVNVAFFHVNSAVSVLLFAGILADLWLG